MSKESYQPAERRFEVSEDSYSRERIRALADIYRELRKAIPEVRTAFSLYGSLSKGKKLNEIGAVAADIDLECFFDSTDTVTHREELCKKYPFYKECEKKLFEKRGAVPEGGRFWMGRWVKNSVLVPIEAMGMVVEGYVGHQIQERLAIPHLDRIPCKPISMDGIDSILNLLTIRLNDKHEGNAEKSVSNENIARKFRLDVGGGLRPYRQDFLYRLTQLDPEVAERYWQEVNSCVRTIERDGVIPEFAEKQFPATFAAAVKYYGLPSKA